MVFMASALLRQDREQLLLQVDVRTIDSTDIIERIRSHIGSNFYITRESVPLYPSARPQFEQVGRTRWEAVRQMDVFPTWTPV